MSAGSRSLVCKMPPLGRAVVVLLLAGTPAVAQEAAFGTLVLQSPVQAVATINGEGMFLLVPGQDLRWSRIRPGSYRIGISSGGQQWQREVQVKPGQTETLIAALSSLGSPLEAGVPPPVNTPAISKAYVPPLPAPPPAATFPTPPETVTQQRKEDREEQEEQRRRDQELLRQQREDLAAQQREREAGERALREAQRLERQQLEEEQSQQKRRRPKVH